MPGKDGGEESGFGEEEGEETMEGGGITTCFFEEGLSSSSDSAAALASIGFPSTIASNTAAFIFAGMP